MELLNEYSTTKIGNDCLIRDHVALIRMSDDDYSVVHVNSVFGGWTGNPCTSKCEVFCNDTSAKEYFDTLVRRL